MKTKDNFLGHLPIELTHALFRVAGSFRSQELRARLESWGIKFLESAALADPKSTASDINTLEQLVMLGETIGEIPYHSSMVLYSQFANIKSAIRQYEERLAADSAIDALFTAPEVETDYQGAVLLATTSAGQSLGKTTSESREFGNTPPITLSQFNSHDFMKFDDGYKKEFSKKIDLIPKKYDSNTTTERQQLIVQKVRQLGNAAMKDLIAEFPSVSERTIRYDLKRLCDELILERRGNGGPASFYCLHEITPPQFSA